MDVSTYENASYNIVAAPSHSLGIKNKGANSSTGISNDCELIYDAAAESDSGKKLLQRKRTFLISFMKFLILNLACHLLRVEMQRKATYTIKQNLHDTIIARV